MAPAIRFLVALAAVGPLASAMPPVSSDLLPNVINQDSLRKRAEALYDLAKLSEDEYGHPTRVIGSPGHNGTLDYIEAEIIKTGDYYNVSRQAFSAFLDNVLESHLVLDDANPPSATPMTLTPPTPNHQPVQADLVLVDDLGCKPANYPAAVRGNIALVKRGTCNFGDKSANAGRAGAVAVVVYNNENGTFAGTLGDPLPDQVATFAISSEDAEPVVEKLRAGGRVNATAHIDSEIETVTTYNIIAQTTYGDQDNCVMVGAHSDSVAAGPGINDDGSGILTLLEVATRLALYDIANCVRFAFFSGEEEGLVGSNFYVSQLSDEENKKIRLFLDYDMLASPNYAYTVYNGSDDVNPAGSSQLRDLFVDYYASHGLNSTIIPFDGRSDYNAFIENGIPAGGVSTGADSNKTEAEVEMFGGVAGQQYDGCYHLACDDTSNLNLTAWEVNSKLVAYSVAVFAISLEDFPERADVPSAKRAAPTSKYLGPNLFI